MASKSNPPFGPIGPFVLETLTTGMYEGSANALREYVQNAYDATRTAVAAGVLPRGEGKVTVTLPDSDTLVVADNGIGLSQASAWGTLTAIGASKKDRVREAGFRGIGRLAAIAFADSLVFRTKVTGEGRATVVTFDCKALRTGMVPNSGITNLADLLDEAVSLDFDNDVDAEDHFMEVTMKGLEAAPAQMRDIDEIRAYLAETSPIEFDPRWPRSQDIVSRARQAKLPFETIKLMVGRTEHQAPIVHKLYGETYALAQKRAGTDGTTSLGDVRYFGAPGWWAWVGVPKDSGSLKDGRVAGLRIRLKNIQVDGTAIMDRLFAERSESYGRFNKFHVGEVHIDPGLVIPNARRDSFEDDRNWRKIRVSIYDVLCDPLAKEAYARSEEGKKNVDRIKVKVEKLRKSVTSFVQKGDPAKTEWATKLAEVEKVRTQVATALQGAAPEATVPLRVQFEVVERLKNQLEGNLEPDAARRLRKSVIEEVLDAVEQIIQPYLATADYNVVRKQLRSRIR